MYSFFYTEYGKIFNLWTDYYGSHRFKKEAQMQKSYMWNQFVESKTWAGFSVVKDRETK